MPHFDLSLILPMCKPKEGWQYQLLNNIGILNEKFENKIAIEVIVVNDGFENKDILNLFKVIGQLFTNVKFISYPNNKGKGFALRTGLTSSTASHIIITDFDFPYEISDIVKIYHLLKSGKEIVVGKRNTKYYQHIPLKRKIVSKACIALNRHVLKLPFADTQSGLKGFNNKGKMLFLATTINRFLVDTEFLLLAHKNEHHISVVNINLRSGINFTNMGWKVILTEGKNFYKIMKINSKVFTTKKKMNYAELASIVNV